MLELWLRVIVGTTLGFDDAVWATEAEGDPGTIRWLDWEVEEFEVKVNPERGSVGKRFTPMLVFLSDLWKALLELRFSME